MKKSIITLVAFISSLMTINAQTFSDTVAIGKTIKVNIPICRIDVSWSGHKGLNNVYAAPAGWQILEFKAKVVSRRQRASYSFDLTPSNFAFSSTSTIDTKFNELLQVIGKKDKKKYEGKIKQIRNDYENYQKKVVATHSSITTTGSVRGNNEFTSRKPGRLYLDLEVTLVYMPVNDQQFQQSIEFLKAMIKEGTLE